MFERETWRVIRVEGTRAALEWSIMYYKKKNKRRGRKITGHLTGGLKKKGRKIRTPLQSDRRSGIVVFEDPDPAATYNKLKSENIVVASRVKSIRASPHYYNSEDEIDRLLMAL